MDLSLDGAVASEGEHAMSMIFSTWKLSEIQKYAEEQAEFKERVDDAAVDISAFVSHFSKIPVQIRCSKNLNVKLEGRERLPRNLPALIKKVDVLLQEGLTFWQAAQTGRGGQ